VSDSANIVLTIGLFFISWLSLWSLIAIPLSIRLQWRPFTPTAPPQKLTLLLPLYLLAPLVIGAANQVLDQSWQDLGIQFNAATGRSLMGGFGLAVAGLLLLLGLKIGGRLVTPAADGDTEFSAGLSPHVWLSVGGLLVLAIAIGGVEEWVFRGWLQTQLEGAVSPWLAAALGSLVFALAHLVWEGRPGVWQQPGLWCLGMVLVIARWADGGNLALAWGLHTGWVWGLACLGEFVPMQAAATGPRWLSGRADQPLTSLLDLGLMLGTAAVLWWGWLR